MPPLTRTASGVVGVAGGHGSGREWVVRVTPAL